MFKVFAFGFETRNKTIPSQIYRLISEALLVAYHFHQMHFQLMDIISLVSDKHVSVSVCVSRGWCTCVVFMQPGVNVNGA